MLRTFRGEPGTPDNHFPEDWLASTVRARNGSNSQGADEGLSRIGAGPSGALLSESLARESEFWWGAQPASHNGMGVLWKLLDAANRLQLQAHPDSNFARR